MYRKLLLSICCALLLCSCSDDDLVDGPPPEKDLVEEQVVDPPIDEEGVVARVNGLAIYRKELERTIAKLVGAEAAAMMDEEATRKVLESMVMSRAISELRLREMTARDYKDMAWEVARFREQWLVREYLAEHGKVAPVTMAMVQQYYDDHPELFGGGPVKLYEMITTRRPLQAHERDELLGRLNDSADRDVWQDWVKELAAAGFPVTYSRGEENDVTLHPVLSRTIGPLAVGEVSQLIFVQETPCLVRVTGERTSPARPLSEVTGEIRKALAPLQMKQAIERVGKEAIANSVIEYKEL